MISSTLWHQTCSLHLPEGMVYLRGLMKLSLKTIALVVLLFGAAATASADGLTLTLNNGGNYTMGGVFVGPYNFTGTTSGGQTMSLQLICDDFQDDVSAGEHWNAVTSTFPTLSNVQFLVSGSPNTAGYQEVAWLAEQMFANIGNAQIVGQLQWAIWDVFDPGISNHDPYGVISAADQCAINGNGCTNTNSWLAQAVLNASTGNYLNLIIYTPVTGSQVPVSDGPPQEYFGDPPPMPEPGTLVLISGGLFSLIGFRRKLSN